MLLIAWVAGLAYFATGIGLWDGDRLTDTVLWVVTAGLVLFGKFTAVGEERHFVRRAALATLEISAIVEVLSEIFVLHLIAEIVLQPFLALLGGLSVVAAQRREHHQVKRLVDGLILIASIGLLLYVVVNLVGHWDSLDKVDLLQQFALPVWLSIGVLPYIYALGLFSAYQLAFRRMDWKSEAGWWQRARLKLALLTSFHVRAHEIGSFSGSWQLKLASATSLRQGRRVIAEFKQVEVDTARETEENRARLTQYAGVDGVDESGRRLDRREFGETTAALRWLGTCQMGWYRNNDADRYRPDLLNFVFDGVAGERLPDPHGVTMRVSADGQKWFAWRRTISGWVFAIGSAGPPPDQWEYDGPEPPTSFPGEDPAWGTTSFNQEVNVNW
jgi:hypothetical protein